MTKLKPCPFCGGIPKIQNTNENGYDRRFYVGCFSPECWVRPVTSMWLTEAGAEKAWNERSRKGGKKWPI